MNRDITLNFKGDARQLNQVIKTIVAEVKSLDGTVRTAGGAAGSKGLFGTITGGNLAARGISELIGLTTRLAGGAADLGVEAVKLAGNFQTTTNALAVFTGSTRLAKQELAEIDKLAADTPGLRLESAEQGFQRLRALGFQAKLAKGIVKELGEEKILSGATDENLQKVIYNFTQIASGGQKVSQELREILTQMPSLKRAIFDAFGTLDPKKIQTFFDRDTDAAFQKLVDAMGRGEAAAGGLNDSFGKLTDAAIQVGRTFGEPILEPLTESFKLLTGSLENNKQGFKEWGDYVGDVIRGVNKEARDFANPKNLTPLEAEGEKGRQEQRQFFSDAYNYLVTPRRPDLSEYAFADKGRREREANAPGGKSIADLRQAEDKIFSKETAAANLALEEKRLQNLEKAKAKELSILKLSADEAGAILKDRFEREQSLRDLQNRYTAQQEIDFLRQTSKDKTAFLQSEIGRQSGYFNKQIELQNGNDEEVAKLEAEKNKAISGLNADLVTESARTQRQIQDLENRIYEERRQAAIEFAGLQIRENESFLDKQAFDLNRAIERQTGDSKEGFDALKTATQKSYEEVSVLTKAQYEKQLQNLSLTDEQRTNILKEMYLTEQDLAEKNRRSILQIEENQYRKSLSNLETVFNRRKELLESYAQSTQFGIGLLSPDAFAANSSSLIQKSLTGNDLPTLKRDTQDALYLQKLKLTDDKKNAQIDLDGAIKSGDKGRVASLGVDLLNLNEALIQNGKQFDDWGSLIDENVFKVDSLVEKIKSGSGAFADFDSLGLESLKLRQKREGEILDAEIASYAKRAEAAGKAGNAVDAETFTYAKLTAERRQGIKAIEDEAEKTAFLAQTTVGLTETLNKLLSGDKVSVDLVKKGAGDNFLREQISLVQENIALEAKFYENSEFLAQRRKNKLLGFEREIFELRQELAEKATFSQTESDAKVLDYINSQVKGLSETFADFRIGLAGNFFDAVTAPFDALKDKLKGLNPIVRGLAETFIDLGRDIVKAFSSKIILRLLGLDSGTGAGGSGSSGGGFDIGGFIKNLLGGRGTASGSSSGGAGGASAFINRFGTSPDGLLSTTPGTIGTSFVNSAGQIVNTGGSTGLSSIFGSQGFGSNVGTYSALGSFAAIGGGLIGGRVGGFLSGAGSGLALGAQIGSLFGPGPGTAIGAAIGAAAGGLLSLLGGDPKRKKDKKEGLPALNKGFVDAFAQLNQVLVDSDALKFNPPEEANTKADGIYSEISKGFDIVFESKKYKAEAKKLIEQKSKDADVLRGQIKKSVVNAKTFGADAAALVPVFATGNYFGSDNQMLDMRMAQKAQRPHGYIAGGKLGIDRHLGLFADGETIINHKDRLSIIQGAGYDVFKEHARIPNYPKYAAGNYFTPKIASGSTANTPTAANNIVIQPQITVYLEGEGISNVRVREVLIDGLQSDEAVKTAVIRGVRDSVALRRT